MMEKLTATGQAAGAIAQPELRRVLSLPLLVLYGLGVTIGAGIYVLVGATAGRAGIHAPFAFCLAALVMMPTAACFAELCGRMPFSAGEGAYVHAGFASPGLGLLAGLLVATAGIVSSAAVAVGSAGYIRVFADIPEPVVIAAVVLAMGSAAAWGIIESVSLAGMFTLLEVGGLVLIIAAGLYHEPALVLRVPEVFPHSLDTAVWIGIFSAGLLAFFAFVGFEDLVNVAEETRQPERTLPRAIFLTLSLSTLIYFAVASVAVLTVPPEELAGSAAPLSELYQRITGGSPLVISAIAIIATLNGIIVQMIMASRVLYGLATRGQLPSFLASVNAITRTPLVSTAIVVVAVLALASLFPIEGLAEMTSRVTLTVFALCNLALLKIRLAETCAPQGIYIAPRWAPLAGFVLSVIFLASSFIG